MCTNRYTSCCLICGWTTYSWWTSELLWCKKICFASCSLYKLHACSFTVSKVATDMSIDELQFETNSCHRTNPTITLVWRSPTDHHSLRDIEYVIYANEQEIQVVPGVRTSVTFKTLRPLKNYMFKVVTRDKGTKEEGLYYQTFETFLGEGRNSVCSAVLECDSSHITSLIKYFHYLMKSLSCQVIF